MTARRDRRERIAINAEARELRHRMGGRRIGNGGWYVDRQGREIDLARWSVLFETRRYRFVLHTRLGPRYFVSTIWEGMVGLRPGAFSTMVFRDDEGCEEYYDRTEAAARVRHDDVCTELFASLLRATVLAAGGMPALGFDAEGNEVADA